MLLCLTSTETWSDSVHIATVGGGPCSWGCLYSPSPRPPHLPMCAFPQQGQSSSAENSERQSLHQSNCCGPPATQLAQPHMPLEKEPGARWKHTYCHQLIFFVKGLGRRLIASSHIQSTQLTWDHSCTRQLDSAGLDQEGWYMGNTKKQNQYKYTFLIQ